MKPQELKTFMMKYHMSPSDIAKLLCVTTPCIDHWLKARRSIPPLISRLVTMFDAYPGCIEVMRGMQQH